MVHPTACCLLMLQILLLPHHRFALNTRSAVMVKLMNLSEKRLGENREI